MGEAKRRGLSRFEEAELAALEAAKILEEFDAEEKGLIRQLQSRGSATFHRGFPYTRNRKVARGDRRIGLDGKKIGPDWKQEVVFSDDDNKVVDLEATRFAIARAYLRRRKMSAGSFSSFKKLSKAARLLNRA